MNFKKLQKNKGMTYVELIVVLAIAGVISTISLFNYKEFQARVDIKNLANDIALKVVESQKSAISGKLPGFSVASDWRPSYGIYFPQLVVPSSNNKTFYLFVDLPTQDKQLDSIATCPGVSSECRQIITIGNGNYISSLKSFVGATGTNITNPLHITFKRPNSGAIFFTGNYPSATILNADYIEITVSNSKASVTTKIQIYASGRVSII